MKKAIILVISSIVIFTGCNTKEKTTKDKLIDIGYNDNNITYIEDNLNEYSISFLLNNDYISSIMDIIKNKDFKESNLPKYIEFINKFNLDINTSVFIVNNEYYTDKYDETTVNLIKQKYFILENLDRYLTYYKNNNKLEEVVRNVNSNIDYAFYTNTNETDTSKGYLMLVNKYNRLSSKYVPNNLVTIDLK